MRRNNFDALRLIAALLVVHGHGWDLTGAPAAGLWNLPVHRIGLDIFFSISGYLVTGSWERGPAIGDFLLKRCLRIFPGLIACVTLTALVLGPIVSTETTGQYFRNGGLLYFTNIALLLQLYLPGVFTRLPEFGAVNGSLWSLAPEFGCYLTVPALARLGGRVRLAALLALAAVAGLTSVAMFNGVIAQMPLIWHCDPKYALAEVPFFALGGFLALLERRMAGDALWRADLCLGFLIANYAVSARFGWVDLPVEWATLPYVVICFGRLALPVLCRAGRFGDASYGTYLYAYPIQKVVLLTWPGDRLPVLTCAAISLCAGLLSWHLVERPVQRWGARAVRRARTTPSLPGRHAQQPAQTTVETLPQS